jgi:hypothetical protein
MASGLKYMPLSAARNVQENGSCRCECKKKARLSPVSLPFGTKKGIFSL